MFYIGRAKLIFPMVTAILGAQWGDEGKGKLIDILAKDFRVIARATGGANAGHTIYLDGVDGGKPRKFVFHLVPSGILWPKTVCVIGNGVVLHLETFFQELAELESAGIDYEGRIFVSDRAHLLFDFHKRIDALQEEMKGDAKVGTTGRGIGPCYADKVGRFGMRVCDLLDWDKFQLKYMANLDLLRKMYGGFKDDFEGELKRIKVLRERFLPMIKNTVYFLNAALERGEGLLAEGANGTLLDLDHGTYPFVTSSSASLGGILTGLGIGAGYFDRVIGVMKSYMSRVGAGSFPTELDNELGQQIRDTGGEFGSTTGRPRRCGWFDAVASRYSVIVNKLTEINLTKLDVLRGLPVLKLAIAYVFEGEELSEFPASLDVLARSEPKYLEMPGFTEDIAGCRKFEDLPEHARNYVLKIEELLGVKVGSIGVGVKRSEILFR